VFVTTRRNLFGLLLIFLDLDDFTTLVKSAIRTDRMRKAHGAAVRAGREIAGLQGVVGAPVVTTAFRVFAFWMWGHSTYSFIFTRCGDDRPTSSGLKRADYSGWREVRQGGDCRIMNSGPAMAGEAPNQEQ